MHDQGIAFYEVEFKPDAAPVDAQGNTMTGPVLAYTTKHTLAGGYNVFLGDYASFFVSDQFVSAKPFDIIPDQTPINSIKNLIGQEMSSLSIDFK